MNLKDLEYFQALETYHSLTAVAEKFKVSQPTISYALKRLETEFGEALIERDQSHKTTFVTAAGEIVLKSAQRINREWQYAHAEVKLHQQSKMRIGLPPIIGTYYFSKIAQKLVPANLLGNIETVEFGSDELLQQLRLGALDFGIVAATQPVDLAGIRQYELAHYDFVLIEANNQHTPAVTFESLANQPFVVHSRGYLHDEVFRRLSAENSVYPPVAYQTPNVEVLKNMVRSGIGMGFITELALQNHDQDLRVVHLLDDQLPKFRIYFLVRETLPLTNWQNQIIDIFKSEVTTLNS
ncbi:LysR family transcriptional regulator [Weissella diestrammenae]|uniref:LysR family transcriptional regulator n=1 Tax=Weissella diestrammenae TaxID=1162633 RepID=A0A7G9T6K9_9LACO|nr:LysR family transcriptional regulator [Weissella diestrammenae]MCM0582988.1 LysR family transcriptional regulator [Weissella diestrammenae]QNN75734.1 LysR family transcriptional regulator [Weissella diestrammenae]